MKQKNGRIKRENLPTEYSTSSGDFGGDGVRVFFCLTIMESRRGVVDHPRSGFIRDLHL